MSKAVSGSVLVDVLSYLENQIYGPDLNADRFEKTIEAGNVLADDEERAEIIIQAVATVLARRNATSPQAKAAIEVADFIAADKERADILIKGVAAFFARKNTKVAKGQSTGVPEAPGQESESAAEPRFRGVLAKTAYQCIQETEGEFTVNSLVGRIRSAGYQFYGHPDVSVNTVLQKFLKDRLIQVVEPGAGRRATVYRERRKLRTGQKAQN